jgi:hypothetical protein
VTVYWEEDKKWYDGAVKVYKPASMSHVVNYDDGDKRDERLHFVHTRWRFLVEPTSTAPESHADTGTAKWAAAFGGMAGHSRTRAAGIEAARFASLAAEATTLAAKLVASSRFLEKWQATIGGSARAGMAHAEDDGEEDDDEEDDGEEDDDEDEEDLREEDDVEDEEDDADEEDERARKPAAVAIAGGTGVSAVPMVTLEAMEAHNRTLQPATGFTSGVRPVQVSENCAQECAEYLAKHWGRSELGGLKLYDDELQASYVLNGFNEYYKTLGEFSSKQQRKHTLRVTKELLPMVRARLPGFHAIELELVDWLRQHFGTRVELLEAHGLRQGPKTRGSTIFSNHKDTEEYPEVQYTVVVKLTSDVPKEPPSAMHIVGHAVDFEYEPTAGAGGMFLADLYHMSVAPKSKNEHLKMTYFFKVAS